MALVSTIEKIEIREDDDDSLMATLIDLEDDLVSIKINETFTLESFKELAEEIETNIIMMGKG